MYKHINTVFNEIRIIKTTKIIIERSLIIVSLKLSYDTV